MDELQNGFIKKKIQFFKETNENIARALLEKKDCQMVIHSLVLNYNVFIIPTIISLLK